MSTSALDEAIYQNTVGNSQGYPEGLSWNTGKNSVTLTLTAAEVNSGLTLTTNYRGHGDPTATLTVTATDKTGTPVTSAAQTITVKDPPRADPFRAGPTADIQSADQASALI